MKFGWGVFGRDRTAWMCKLVEAARAALGDDSDLLVDTGWFVERTREGSDSGGPLDRAVSALSCRGVASSGGLRWLPASLADAWRLALPAASRKQRSGAFSSLIERGGVDVLQPDLTRCGGFTVARKIVHMAERAKSAGDSAFLVERSAHSGVAASDGVSAASGVRRVQHIARSLEPACW